MTDLENFVEEENNEEENNEEEIKEQKEVVVSDNSIKMYMILIIGF